MAARAVGPSAGTTTAKPGSAAASATSSIPICEGPSSPIEMPLWLPATLTGRLGKATDMRSWSKALHIMKQAKLAIQVCLPEEASPLAMPTRLDSAMPTWKKRSGNSLPKYSVRVELETSASTTTRCGSSWPNSASALPKASRVAGPISNVNLRSILAAVFVCMVSLPLTRPARPERCQPPPG